MGKASSTKKVARAAGTGGGRTAHGRRPYGWYTVLGLTAALGVFLVAFSRHEQQAAASVHPRGSDHWHAAYGIDICGQFQPNLVPNPNLTSSTAPPGIHTHGDGLIHAEPFFSGQSADAGNNATLARFAQDYPGFTLTSSEIQLPGGQVYKNGQKCDKKPAVVRFRVWAKASGSDSITYSNPNDVHLRDQQAITIAFLPATDDIPKPPPANISRLRNPTESAPSTTVVPTQIPGTTPTTAAGTTATTAVGASTPTTASGSVTPTTSAGGGTPTTAAGAGTPTTAAGSPPTTR